MRNTEDGLSVLPYIKEFKMKKLCVALSLALVAGFASAEDAYSLEVEHPVTYVEVGLAAPLQVPPSNWNVDGFRWSLFYSRSYKMRGFDLGLVGQCDDAFSGLALQTVNWVGNDFTGAQFGGLFNVVQGKMTGAQFGGLLNYNHDLVTGFQSALINYDGAFVGGQIGVVNWDKGLCWGFELGVINANVADFRGAEVGAVNYAERFSGLQLGVVNVVGETGSGCQIGVFNAAPKFQGCQIGFLNVIGNGDVPILPVFNASF